jgi:ketosteroid isomerase-like protein
MEAERFIDAGDRVVAIMHIRGTGRGSGVEVTMQSADVRTISDGKIVRHVGFPDASDALEATGLQG